MKTSKCGKISWIQAIVGFLRKKSRGFIEKNIKTVHIVKFSAVIEKLEKKLNMIIGKPTFSSQGDLRAVGE